MSYAGSNSNSTSNSAIKMIFEIVQNDFGIKVAFE